MESHKRKYSNSPFYRNILSNNNNIMNIMNSNQQSYSSQNLDSFLSNSNDNQEIKEFNQILYEKNLIIQK